VKRNRTPQEKKILSYAKDGRNTVAEARSKSRVSIAKHKAAANRALRRAEVVAVSKVDPAAEVVDVVVERTGRKSWRKIPDAPLAEYVGRTLNRRSSHGMTGAPKQSELLKKGRKGAKPRPLSFKGPLQNDG
jgi:hypothetical protein